MFTYSEKYKFTEKWFDNSISTWEEIFKAFKGKEIKDVLEVGCYEGRATIFLAEKVLGKNVSYDVVDTFGGSLEESGMSGTANRLAQEDFIFNNFMHNTAYHPQINFNTYRGYSQYILPTLTKQGRQYDFIYIDASHRSDDTFVDAYYAHKMLKKEGILIFDDFGWKDPSQPDPVSSPELGIRSFFTMYEKEYQIFMSGYQIGATKK